MSISFKVVENPEGATLRNSFGNESLFWLVMSTYWLHCSSFLDIARCNSADTSPFGFSYNMKAKLMVEFGIDMTDNDRVSFAVVYFPRSPSVIQESIRPRFEFRTWLSET